MLTILDATRAASVFASWFRDPSTGRARFACVAALFALPMDAEALALYSNGIGRRVAPMAAAIEAWGIAGRRAGRSSIAALEELFVSCFRDDSDVLAAARVAPGDGNVARHSRARPPLQVSRDVISRARKGRLLCRTSGFWIL